MRFTRVISMILTAVMLSAVLCSCGDIDTTVPKGYKKISEEKIGYSFYVPTEWISDISTGVTTAYVSETDRSNVSFVSFELDTTIIQATVGRNDTSESESGGEKDAEDTTNAVTSAPESEAVSGTEGAEDVPDIKNIDQYWEYYSGEFKKTFPDMEYQKEGENMLLSGLEAKKYVYTATVTGQKYQFMQVVAVKAGTVYVFTYTALPEKFEEHLEQVEEIVGNIKIDL